MKTTSVLLSFVIGVVVGVAGHWYMMQPRTHDMLASARESMHRSTAEVRDTTANVGDSFNKTFDSDKIKDELARTGRVVRDKTSKAGEAVADAAANARITTSVKTKLVADTGLSAFRINVDTTDGVVTLSGTVKSAEDIGTAIKLAMETEGVHRVVSLLTVKPS